MDPITRKEQYYNAILTGDKSNLPTPITREEQYLYAIAMNGGGGGGGGTSDYNQLEHLPKVNNVTLKGNKTPDDLGLASKSAISNVLRDGGMIACADLIADLLVAANYGKVYITSDTGTTTSNFVDGDGVSIAAGDNVEITNVGTAENPVYKFKLNMASGGGGGSSNTFNEDDFVVEDNEVSLAPAQRIFTGTTAEWEALTAEKKALYSTVQLTDDDDANYKDVYSTSEVKTNKVWIDGKPIYRKVFTELSLSLNGDGNWHDFVDAPQNLENIVQGWFMRSESAYDHHGLVNPVNALSLNEVNNKIAYATKFGWTTQMTGLVLEYTKTTD